jgi:tetratricopeptide (TPR) repeat protein
MALEDDISEIRKEIIESHNLIIKTDNLIKSLSAEIRQIQKKQEAYERKYIFNSVIAYVLFVAIIFVGLYIAFDAKVGVVRREKDMEIENAKKARADANELQNKLSSRSQQERLAEDFLHLKQENREVDALKAADQLDLNLLSPLLAQIIRKEGDELRTRMAERFYEEGKNHFQENRLEQAIKAFDKVLEIKPPANIIFRTQYLRGHAFIRLNRSGAAAEAFLAAVEVDPKNQLVDEITFLSGDALENAGNVPQAMAAFRKLCNESPESKFKYQACRRIDRLAPKAASPITTPTPPIPAQTQAPVLTHPPAQALPGQVAPVAPAGQTAPIGGTPTPAPKPPPAAGTNIRP